ncbi:MAG: hypothetical protein WBV94_15090 [Blastocatellia bacterium]
MIMTQSDIFTYRVARGETVTLSVALTGLPPNVVKVSKAMQPVAGRPLTWSLTVPDKGKKVFNVVMEISFVSAPASAVITIEGDQGGSFSLPPITENSPDKDPGFTFRVK